MIEELHIAGLGVIDDASLTLAPGFTVVTGETGAGKTMLVTALQLLLGARAGTALVRAGARAALVEARVVPPPPGAVEGGWIAAGDDEFVASREIPADGRSRARLSGRLAPVAALAQTLGPWVEVHAQGTQTRLADPGVQRALLDRYAGPAHARMLGDYRRLHREWVGTRAARRRLAEDARERARVADRLAHEVAEIAAAGLAPEEVEALEAEFGRLAHAEDLAAAAGQATAALDEGGAGGPLGTAVAALRRAAGHDPVLDSLRARAEGLQAEAADLRRELRTYGEMLEADPARLEEIRARQRLIADLQRKYGDDVAAVLRYAEEAEAKLAELHADDTRAADLSGREAELAGEVRTLVAVLRHGRCEAAGRLAAAVETHLAELAMPHARFRVAVEALDEPGEDGADRVVYELAANPGEPPRPLAEAASGGERSRVALAVEVALADADDAEVVVFDEVDAGVGGEAAMAVGEKLAALAADGTRQVLCVTHLAQIAAFADAHHVVEKAVRGGRAVTTVRRVGDGGRAAELARMLSGSAGGDAALDHARALLAEAGRRRGAVPARRVGGD